MAIASITLTCNTCGKKFEHRRNCYNRSEANRYEQWAENNITECPACWHKAQEAAKAKALADKLTECGFVLPVIEGVSDKQIAYAEKLRTRYLADDLGKLDDWKQISDTLADSAAMEDIAKQCAERGVSVEYALDQAISASNLAMVRELLTLTDAKKIIDIYK